MVDRDRGEPVGEEVGDLARGFLGIVTGSIRPFVDLDGVSEPDLDIGPPPTAILVDEADGHDHDAAYPRVDRAERDARRAGLERQQRRPRVHLAFGEDRDVGASRERRVTRFERRNILPGVDSVAATMDRYDAAQ